MKIIGYITTTLIAFFITPIWSGYVLSILWRWFVVPSLGAPVLTVGYAIGLSLVVGYMTQRHSKVDDPDWEKGFGYLMAKRIFIAMATPLLALGVGRIVVAFV